MSEHAALILLAVPVAIQTAICGVWYVRLALRAESEQS